MKATAPHASATPRRSRRISPDNRPSNKAERILLDLCSIPTAPFAEDRVVRYIKQFVADRPGLKLAADSYGNLLISLSANKNPRQPRWVFAAHMDHPGFVARRMLDGKTLEADFRGSVRGEYFIGRKVRFFAGENEIPATVIDCTVGVDRPYPSSATLNVSKPVPAGAPGTWDQGAGRIKGGKFYSRVCDDLAGAAAALAMIDNLREKPPAAPVAVLLTRAEEEGFIGAIAAVLHPRLLRKKTDRLIAIECSAMQPYAPQGAGAIIRVGDRTSIFNSSLTYFLTQQAEALAKSDPQFRCQRALMPGGTCEATVYDAWGYHAASICVPLGNYHNMDSAKNRIGPEYIDLADWHNMVKLFVQIARSAQEYTPGLAELKQRVTARFERFRHLLQ